MKEIKAWVCSYCNKVMKYKKAMEKHELSCMAGKEPRNCFVCDKVYFAKTCESYGHPWYMHRTCEYCEELNNGASQCDEITTNLALECEHFAYTSDRLFTGLKLDELSLRNDVIRKGNYKEVRKKQILK